MRKLKEHPKINHAYLLGTGHWTTRLSTYRTQQSSATTAATSAATTRNLNMFRPLKRYLQNSNVSAQNPVFPANYGTIGGPSRKTHNSAGNSSDRDRDQKSQIKM